MDLRPKDGKSADRQRLHQRGTGHGRKGHRLLGIGHDITKRKESESKFQLLTERLSLATSVAAVGVWEWDVANSSMTWDDTMEEIYGFALKKESPYEQWSAAVHPEDLPLAEGALKKDAGGKGPGNGGVSESSGQTAPSRHLSAAEGRGS